MYLLFLFIFLIIYLLYRNLDSKENFEGWYPNRSPICQPLYQAFLYDTDKETPKKVAMMEGCVGSEYW